MRALGAKIVPVSYEEAWKAANSHQFEGLEGTFIHPFDNHDFIAGHATMGLEILEDLPQVTAVIGAIGGGGLITALGSAIKLEASGARVLGAEPSTAAPFAFSLREGAPKWFPDWQPSFVDGAGGKSVTNRMWERMRPVTDGAITVTLEQTQAAMRAVAQNPEPSLKVLEHFPSQQRSAARPAMDRLFVWFRGVISILKSLLSWSSTDDQLISIDLLSKVSNSPEQHQNDDNDENKPEQS